MPERAAESLSELVLRRAPLVYVLKNELDRVLDEISEDLTSEARAWHEEVGDSLELGDGTIGITFDIPDKLSDRFYFYLSADPHGFERGRRIYVEVLRNPGDEEGISYQITTVVQNVAKPPGAGFPAFSQRLSQLDSITPPGKEAEGQRIWETQIPIAGRGQVASLISAFREHLDTLPTVLREWESYCREIQSVPQ